MSYPEGYERLFDYSSYQNANPTRPLPGIRVNIDLNDVERAINETNSFIRGVTRADGKLANNSVGLDQLDSSAVLGFSTSVWAPNTAYTLNSAVFEGSILYKAKVAHTSGSVFDATKWTVLVDLNGFSGIWPVANGGTGTGTAFTQGSIPFAGVGGVYSQDNANFFWDAADARLGIGTNTPVTQFQVKRPGSVLEYASPIPNAVLITDGSFSGTPVSNNTGTVTISRAESQASLAPWAAALNVINVGTATTNSQTNGIQVFVDSYGLKETCAVSVASNLHGASTGQSAFAFFGLASAWTAGNGAIAIETATGNETGVNQPYSPVVGVNLMIGLDISYGSSQGKLGGPAIQIRAQPGIPGAYWDVGLGFMQGNHIKTALIQEDDTLATSILLSKGTHIDGLNLSGGTFSGHPIVMPNNKSIAWLNTSAAPLDVILLDSSNNVRIQAASGAQVAINGDLAPLGSHSLGVTGGRWPTAYIDTLTLTNPLAATNGGTNNGFFAVTGPTTSTKTFTFPNASATVLTTNAAVTVAQGGTGLTSGTSGGILGFTASGTLASSGALAANAIVVGGGSGATPNTPATTPPTVSSAGIVSVVNATDGALAGTGALVLSGGGFVTKNFIIGGSGRLGVGIDPTALAVAEFAQAQTAPTGNAGAPFFMTDTTSFAAGVGGRLGFRGKFNSGGSYAELAAVAGVKANATDGNFEGLMNFYVRGNGTSNWGNPVGSMDVNGSHTVNQQIAIPAGGTAGLGLKFSTTANFGVFFGSGAPSLSAAKGSLYLRSDGSTTNDRAYINTNGSTTWTALTTAA